MHPQLLVIREDLGASSDRLSLLAERTNEEDWVTRPSAESWSASECIQHLNATSRAMVPLIREQLNGSAPVKSVRRFRFNFMGWLVWRASSPPVRMKYKTQAPFVPAEVRPKKEDVVAWAVCQSDVLDALERSEGHDLRRLAIVSPFDGRVRYNLYAAFRIIAAHQQRHLDQAEQAVTAVRAGRS
jgi:hypothetical protein